MSPKIPRVFSALLITLAGVALLPPLSGCSAGPAAGDRASGTGAGPSLADAPDAVGPTFERLPATEFKTGLPWLNTDRPLTLQELRGHVIILDFWTYGCVNCLHVIPELRRIEREYADRPVVVIGVHSGKFAAERDPQRIRAAMRRYQVDHPVVVDSEFAIWKSYHVRAWPTLVVIDAAGKVVGAMSGEPRAGFLGKVVGSLLAEAERAGTLASERVAITRPELPETGPLSYPGKVAVASDGRIAIADSNHHRIVLVDGQGHMLATIGSGIAGSADGDFADAAFQRPHGLVFDHTGKKLYVADTENHQLRLIDLAARTVTTIAGTGEKGTSAAGGLATEVPLRSPWDLAFAGDALYVAMAGTHQIWRYHLGTRRIEPFAGTGRESIIDGPVIAAAFSQPSGLSMLGRTIYVADSEVSGVRAIDLDTGMVRTLAGTGLFDFGDTDGVGDDIRLQHALGVTAVGDQVYVADTYNHKIKRLDPRTRRIETIGGGDRADLHEPGGLVDLGDGRLLIADTNNHRLRTLDIATGTLADFPLSGVRPPAAAGLILASRPQAAAGASQPDPASDAKRPRIELAARGQLGLGSSQLLVDLHPPAGGKLSVGSPMSVRAYPATGLQAPERTSVEYAEGALPIRIPLDIDAGAAQKLDLDVSFYWCTTGDEGACIPERANLTVALDIDESAGPGEATFAYRAE